MRVPPVQASSGMPVLGVRDNIIIPVNIPATGYGADIPQSPDRHSETRKPFGFIVK